MEAEAAVREGRVEPHLAEAVGVKEVLSWIKSKATTFNQELVPHISVQIDCLIVVQALSSSISLLSPFGLIIQECRRLLETLSNVSVSFIKRSGNKAANWLARSSCSSPGRISVGDLVPLELKNILLADSN